MNGTSLLGKGLAAAARGGLIGLVHAYQGLSSVTPGSCRHMPCCSQYALTALRRHGALKGGWLALRRLSRCHPWGSWGYDPVPPAAPRRARPQEAEAGGPERRIADV